MQRLAVVALFLSLAWEAAAFRRRSQLVEDQLKSPAHRDDVLLGQRQDQNKSKSSLASKDEALRRDHQERRRQKIQEQLARTAALNVRRMKNQREADEQAKAAHQRMVARQKAYKAALSKAVVVGPPTLPPVGEPASLSARP
mmetsp:Transcript_3372/g.9000  ORF Transcript_3372/g.9000 Transcript_3372/m.9000 type:complete len:142 (-) Transcript_3372:32-457(-)